MKKLLQAFPPYGGDKPYIYFAFCENDAKKVRPLMERLYRRDCRIWYPSGKAADLKAQKEMTGRRLGAALVLVYMSEAALRDEDNVKSNAGFCQSRGCKLILLNETDADGLSTGLADGTPFVSLDDVSSPEEAESRLIRTEGFSQELIGEVPASGVPLGKRLAILLTALVIAALSLCYIFGFFESKDTVTINDPVILSAAHDAYEGALNEEALAQINTLHLDSAPESFDELGLFPELMRLEIPADCVQAAAALLGDTPYEIVVYGGE